MTIWKENMTKNYFITMQKGFLALMTVALLFSYTQNESFELETPIIDNNSLDPAKGIWKQVGYLKDGKPILNLEEQASLKSLNNNLRRMSNIDENFTDISIVANDNGNYNLVFKGETYKTSFFVTTNESNELVALTTTSCTTSDCSQEPMGCRVMYQVDEGYCSPCENKGKCTKTSSDASIF